jgi:hypothetical protein
MWRAMATIGATDSQMDYAVSQSACLLLHSFTKRSVCQVSQDLVHRLPASDPVEIAALSESACAATVDHASRNLGGVDFRKR